FFSSRRRHTRFSRDWSSDVCSSDLAPTATEQLAAFCKAASDVLRLDILRVLRNDSFGVLELAQIFDTRQSGMSHHLKVLANAGRSEERRVGKECRTRWARGE